MFLVQLLLPLYDNQGKAFDAEIYHAVRNELVAEFGGVTGYTRAPASGLWQEEGGAAVRDDIVIYEVMAEHLDEPWWHAYRSSLERRFRQDAIIVRAHAIRML